MDYLKKLARTILLISAVAFSVYAMPAVDGVSQAQADPEQGCEYDAGINFGGLCLGTNKWCHIDCKE